MQLAHVKSRDLHVPYTFVRGGSHDDKMMSDKERADYKKAWQLFADYADKNDDVMAGVEYPPPPAKRARNHEVQ